MNVWKGWGPQLGDGGYWEVRPRMGELFIMVGRPLWVRGQVSSYRVSSSSSSSAMGDWEPEDWREEDDVWGEGRADRPGQESSVLWGSDSSSDLPDTLVSTMIVE